MEYGSVLYCRLHNLRATFGCICISEVLIEKSFLYFNHRFMRSSAFSGARKHLRLPAGVAAASASSFLVGQFGCANTSRRFTANASNSAAEALIKNSTAKTAKKSFSNRTASTTSSPGGSSFIQWYESHLKTNPVKTKMATGGVLWVSQFRRYSIDIQRISF